ncbi:immediate early response 3-interacting protein 1-like [Hydractinia symbiolongicarpus]|uniref:immediate early response 3-interacting protein 1-like n=1 Tax=Hydractinia symbiolongicarpus TaxID=13093 RepID=UPI00254F645A|nr:immediate early response 3-interacting protein 1-like [Hydractinia symbiolongicarpus]
MAFGLYSLLEVILLVINAMAVLNEERFLSKVGWGADQMAGFGDQPGVKQQLLNLIRSVRTVMRIPLIGVNAFVIIVKLLMG